MHQPFHDLHSSNAAALRQTPRGRLFCLFKIVNRKQLFFSFISHRLRGHFKYWATFLLFPRLACFPSVSEQQFHLFWLIFGLIKGRGKRGRKNAPCGPRGAARKGSGSGGSASLRPPGHGGDTAGPLSSGRAAHPRPPPAGPPGSPSAGFGDEQPGPTPLSPSAPRSRPSAAPGDPWQRGDLRANLIN